jgi:hypothetical protein
MAMFANQRQLGVSPMMMGAGARPQYGLVEGGVIHGVPFRPPRNPGMFSADPGVAFSGAMNNMNSLEHMGDQAFVGNQSRLDRELQGLLQQRQLANNINLANIDQGTQFGVQDRRNSGALDQINASGGWERAITGDKLGSNERLASLQRDLDFALARGGWEQQGLDRNSSEYKLQQELNNRTQLQRMQGDQQIGAINAQGGVNLQLQGLEGNQRMQQLGLQGDQAMQLQGLVGGQNQLLEGLRGANELAVTGVRERGAGDRTRATLESGERNTRAELAGALERARLGDTTQRFGIRTEADVKREGIRAGLIQSAGDRAFQAGESQAERNFRSEQLGKQLAAQYPDPQHRAAVEKYELVRSAAQANMATAQAKVAELQAVRQSDPRMFEIGMKQAQAELGRAMAQQAIAEKDLANAGLNAQLVEAQIADLKVKTENERDPTRQLNAMVDFMRNNPGVQVGGDALQVNPQALGQSSTTANPLAGSLGASAVPSEDASWLPFYGGTEAAKADQVIERMFPGVKDPQQRALLRTMMMRGGQATPSMGDMYSPGPAYSY